MIGQVDPFSSDAFAISAIESHSEFEKIPDVRAHLPYGGFWGTLLDAFIRRGGGRVHAYFDNPTLVSPRTKSQSYVFFTAAMESLPTINTPPSAYEVSCTWPQRPQQIDGRPQPTNNFWVKCYAVSRTQPCSITV